MDDLLLTKSNIPAPPIRMYSRDVRCEMLFPHIISCTFNNNLGRLRVHREVLTKKRHSCKFARFNAKKDLVNKWWTLAIIVGTTSCATADANVEVKLGCNLLCLNLRKIHDY